MEFKGDVQTTAAEHPGMSVHAGGIISGNKNPVREKRGDGKIAGSRDLGMTAKKIRESEKVLRGGEEEEEEDQGGRGRGSGKKKKKAGEEKNLNLEKKIGKKRKYLPWHWPKLSK
jgi:hypothetical protein